MRRLLLLIAAALLITPQAQARSVLFDTDSGFTHARTEPRTSITVERKQWPAPAMHWWNLRAGWRLFKFGPSPTEVTLHAHGPSDCTVCAFVIDPLNDWNAPYSEVGIVVNPTSRALKIVVHELGHALGFRDTVMNGLTKRKARKLLAHAGYR